MGEAAQHYCER